jgi:hypothetical protein
VSGRVCGKKRASLIRFLPQTRPNHFKSKFIGKFDVGGGLRGCARWLQLKR